MAVEKKHPLIAVATGTRADWGLLSPLARELRRRGAIVRIVATNMHLMPQFGDTWREIENDGFEISARIPAEGDMARIAAMALDGFSRYLREENPDAMVILGDRCEMLGAASAALLTGVPIVHVAGGTLSLGAVDDSVRHAITKMAWLHLVETEKCRQRVLAMGEEPERVLTTGAIGVCNSLELPRLSENELEEDFGIKVDSDTFVATLHPTTLSHQPPVEQMREFAEAVDLFMQRESVRFIITYPNNDSDAAPLIKVLEELRQKYPSRILLVPSLGRLRYLSALGYAGACVGNSSSGIVEAPSFHIPVLDIGTRQQGRECATSVIHCECSADDILEGLLKVRTPEERRKAKLVCNPYYRDGTIDIMASAIMNARFVHFPRKHFYPG